MPKRKSIPFHNPLSRLREWVQNKRVIWFEDSDARQKQVRQMVNLVIAEATPEEKRALMEAGATFLIKDSQGYIAQMRELRNKPFKDV